MTELKYPGPNWQMMRTNQSSENLRSQERSALTDTAERVRNALSVEGRANLDKFIQEYVKRSIVIYGD